MNKEQAIKQIQELQKFIKEIDESNDWIKIGYGKIPKETFDKYGAKPFEIQRIKMRNSKGEVWNNISWPDAKKETEKLGCRLPSVQEMLVLMDAYKKEYPNNADVNHKEFLGIEELSYQENVRYEFVDAPVAFVRGGGWGYGSNAGPFT